MSTLIVYFSLEGNTKFICEKIAETISTDIISLKTRKKYPTEGFKKYFWGGVSAILGEKPKLSNEHIDLNPYKTIIIGTPVWNSTFAPPIKTFLSQYKIENKQVAIYACHGAGKAEKCFKNIKEAIPMNEFIGEVDFVEPKRHNEESTTKAVEWAKSLGI